MSDLIRLLPDSVANQIAAGEVIQRPASVVKELVENSVDAGATEIELRLVDAGRTSIQVIDNGKGMSETDARLAFERHATSKIKTSGDLFSLNTLGFRGEALASVAAVAQVDLKTRTEEEELGTYVAISASKMEGQEVVACPRGCNLLVKNLFYNVPARRKFLRSNQTELSNVMTEVERVALVHPEIAFSVFHNESELLNLPASTLRPRIQTVFGKKVSQELLAVEVETSLVKLEGYVAVPESARKKGSHQFFFVNGRYMRHPYFHKAVMEAYNQLVPIGEQVSYFLYFEVPASKIDVNIHPTKTEIKFEDEQLVWQIVVAAVKETLGRFNAVPSIDFDTEDRPDIPLMRPASEVEMPRPTVDVHYNPFHSHTPSAYQRSSVNWDSLYSSDSTPQPPSDSTPLYPSDEPEPSSLFPANEACQEKSASCYQFKGKYILTSVKSGLMVIDQHRAHVRILYDRYLHQLGEKKGISQGVLFPEIVQLPLSDAVLLEHQLDDFQALGFDITNMGGGSFAIQGVPTGIEGLNAVELVRSMVLNTKEKGNALKEEIHSALALTMAKSAAIVWGQVLADEEMNTVIDELFACTMPNYTPDGKLIFCIYKDTELEALFH